MSIEKRWRLRLVCCGRDDGIEYFETWAAAESFRQSYCSGPGTEPGGHERAGIIDEVCWRCNGTGWIVTPPPSPVTTGADADALLDALTLEKEGLDSTALLHIDSGNPDVAAALRARLKDGE